MMQIDVDAKLNFTTADLIGSRCAVLGVSGSGKSMTARVLVEELLPHVPMTLVDIEGELWSLKEQFDILHVGSNFRAESDLIVAPEDAGSLATWVWANNVSVILDMSEFDKTEDRNRFLLNYFEALWSAASGAPKPHTVLIEEVHEFVPEDGTTFVKDLFTRFAKRGRKRGIGMIFVSQRSAEVSKALLTQAGLFFLHRVTYPTDMAVYTKLLPMLPPKQVPGEVSTLKSGVCLAVQEGTVKQVAIRLSRTHHVGATPTGEQTQIALKRIDAAMLEQLRGALNAEPVVKVDPAVEDKLIELQRKVVFESARATEAERERDRLAKELEEVRKRLQESAAELTKVRLEFAQIEAPRQLPLEVPPPAEDDDGPYRSPLALTRRKKAQERGFLVLLDKVEQLRPMVREILFQMGAAPERKWRISELARGLFYSEVRVSEACRTLWEMELLRRDNPQTYQANLAALFVNRYPDLNTEELQDRLFNVCIPRKLAGA